MLGKAGTFIFSLGLVNIFEYIIVNLLLLLFCFKMKQDLLSKSDSSMHPFLAKNLYTVLIFAYFLGNQISLSSIQGLTLAYPRLPVLMQFVNLVLWVANLQYGFVSSLNIVFFWCMWIGVHSRNSL